MKEEPSSQFSPEEINKNIYNHVKEIGKEFKAGFELLKRYPRKVTIFGSARSKSDSFHYQQAEKLGGRIARELGYTIVTGGGPGIMEAASKGAHDSGGKTLGLTISFPRGQVTNRYVSECLKFNYFFIRKAILTFSAQAFVFFPGGFGTFDELFNILNLTQTEKIPRVPIILIGRDFWEPLRDYIKAKMLEHHHTVSEEDVGLFIITDNLEAAVRTIGRGHTSGWWNVMD